MKPAERGFHVHFLAGCCYERREFARTFADLPELQPKHPTFFVHPLQMHHPFPRELPLLADRAGPRVAARLGVIARGPFVGECRRYLWWKGNSGRAHPALGLRG